VHVDLTGSQDGAVRLWEWDHRQPVTVLRAPGNFPKVTKCLFNQHGNKVENSLSPLSVSLSLPLSLYDFLSWDFYVLIQFLFVVVAMGLFKANFVRVHNIRFCY
jgi:hypothetical protein